MAGWYCSHLGQCNTYIEKQQSVAFVGTVRVWCMRGSLCTIAHLSGEMTSLAHGTHLLHAWQDALCHILGMDRTGREFAHGVSAHRCSCPRKEKYVILISDRTPVPQCRAMLLSANSTKECSPRASPQYQQDTSQLAHRAGAVSCEPTQQRSKSGYEVRMVHGLQHHTLGSRQPASYNTPGSLT